MFELGPGGMWSLIALIGGAMFKEQLANLWRIIIAHCWKTGKYNLDGKRDTVDWCNALNESTGEWYLLKILQIGWFVVTVQDRDKGGNTYDRPIGVLEWLKKPTKHASIAQKEVIRIAGNDWPDLPKGGDVDTFTRAEIKTLLSNASREFEQRLTEKLKPINGSVEKIQQQQSENNVGLSRHVERSEQYADLKENLEVMLKIADKAATKEQFAENKAEITALQIEASNRKAAVTKYAMKRIPENSDFLKLLAIAVKNLLVTDKAKAKG